MIATRPLRSLALGDCDYYLSPYLLGVAQACGRLGIAHTQISVRNPAHVIAQRIADARPDLLWTHMLLWPPPGAPPVGTLLAMCREAHRHGAVVLLHDGDVKPRTRYPQSVEGAVDLALCNHHHDRSAWGVPALYWPYAAFPQDSPAGCLEEWRCDVAFAGQLGDASGIYGARTRLVTALRAVTSLHVRVFDGSLAAGGNTLLRTPELAASALCVLGMGRPEHPEWTDTRVFQYPGAGAVLLHDDVQGHLEPWVHYVPYDTGDAASVAGAVERVRALGAQGQEALRARAFAFGQEKHSWTTRVRQVLAWHDAKEERK